MTEEDVGCYLANMAAREERRPSRRVAREVENRKMSSQERGEGEGELEGERRLKYKVERNQKSEFELSLR